MVGTQLEHMIGSVQVGCVGEHCNGNVVEIHHVRAEETLVLLILLPPLFPLSIHRASTCYCQMLEVFSTDDMLAFRPAFVIIGDAEFGSLRDVQLCVAMLEL